MNQSSRVGEPREPRDGGGSTDEVEARLQASVRFMSIEFRRNPRLSEIARVAHFSEYHFHRLFRRRFGRTPKQTLVDMQIDEVKRLMLAGHRPSDAARRAGFAHQSHLTARFKRQTGMTPKQWLLARRGPATAAGGEGALPKP